MKRLRKAGKRTSFVPPFGYGFLGGDFFPNEDAAVSTWNDIHYACHFQTAPELQRAMDEVDANNKVIVELSRTWQDRPPTCDLKGPWGKASVFLSRVTPLVATLERNRNRLFALWVFDEPDVRHKGPRSAELRAAVDYLHQAIPGVPVFVNWFTARNNTKVPNADWYSTTKGAKVSALSGLGKPMFLWWFNNEARPSATKIRTRWDKFVQYHVAQRQPPIISLAWCCDSIENPSSPATDNSPELNALLAQIGRELKEGKLFGVAQDTTPPTVAILSPTEGATVSGRVQVRMQASDNLGIAKVECAVDGVLRHSDTSASLTYAWDTTTVADGVHSVHAQAHDLAGNVASHTVTVSVVNQRPLAVTNVSPKGYTAVPLQIGACYYRDRPYTLQSLPSFLRGQVWIMTRNADKVCREKVFLRCRVNQRVAVFVGYDARASRLPTWLATGWTDTDAEIHTTDVPLKVYRRDYPAGLLQLGGNAASPAAGARSMYVVALAMVPDNSSVKNSA